MDYSDIFKTHEDMFYKINVAEWDSDINLSNAINQFCGFLNIHTTYVEPYINGVSSFIEEFTYLEDELREMDKRSRINRVSDIKAKSIQLLKKIDLELKNENTIRYKSKQGLV